MGLIAILGSVVAIILLTAFYVAAEISLAGSRRSRIQQLQDDGNTLADKVGGIIHDPSQLSAYISSCQISITICSIVLGFVGQAGVAPRVEPLLLQLGLNPTTATSLAVGSTLLVLSMGQVFIGELVPKNLGIRIPERLAMVTVNYLRAYHFLFQPFLWIFNLFNRAILFLVRVEVTHQHGLVLTDQEIRRISRESQEQGQFDWDEGGAIDRTLNIDKEPVSAKMVARKHIFAAPEWTPADLQRDLLANSPYSRMPVFDGSLDNLTRTVHLRDLMCGEEPRPEANPDPFPAFAEEVKVDDALADMLHNKVHLAVVRDKLGATTGIITLEQLVEAVVGDIRDEFDQEQPPPFRFINDDVLFIEGSVDPMVLATTFDPEHRHLEAGALPLEPSPDAPVKMDAAPSASLRRAGPGPTDGFFVNATEETVRLALQLRAAPAGRGSSDHGTA